MGEACHEALDVKGKRVLVLGLGETGLATAQWLVGRGARLRVADSRHEPPGLGAVQALLPAAELHLGPWRDESFAGVDLIAISPGVPRETPEVQRSAAAGTPIVGDVELLARSLGNENRPRVIAVTGTNGKSTVTALAGAMCRSAGLDVEVAGNIGPAVLAALAGRETRFQAENAGAKAQPDAWVLELSSFQLESTASLAPDAATMLNLSEDHLDRYAGMREYAAAKQRIFIGAQVQVLNRDDAASMAMARPGCRILTFGLDAPRGDDAFGLGRAQDAKGTKGTTWLMRGQERLIATSELPLAGRHNAANALAALALCQAIGLPMEPLLAALRTFRGLPHRVSLVAEHAGVRFYDDSKGTNVGSTVAALDGLAEQEPGGRRVVLIAGGDGKGQNFAPLATAVAGSARAVVLIGRDAPQIAAALAGCPVPVVRSQSLEEAVAIAADHARPGDAVLLSPACASLDMFRNYVHRGEVFCAAVEALIRA